MSIETYDAVVIGAGVIGCAMARELSGYDLSGLLLLALGRQRPDEGIEEIRHVPAMGSRNGKRVVPAEPVELGRLELALLVVGLVRGDQHRRPG